MSADGCGGGGRGGGEDDVDAAEEFEELIAEDAAGALGVDVVGGGEEAALVEEGADVGSDFEAATLEPLHGGGGFREKDDAGGRIHRGDVGDADDFDLGTEAGGELDHLADGGVDGGVDLVEVVVFGDADADVLEGDMGGGEVVIDGFGAGCIVEGIGAGEGLEAEGGVAYGAGKGSHVVEGEVEGEDASAADATVGGLEAYGVAEGGGDADGAPGVAAHGHEAEVGGDGGTGATGGAAGDAIGIPGVADGAEVGVRRGDAIGEFVHVGFAEEDGAGGGEFFGDGGVGGGEVVLEEQGAEGGADTFSFEDVFEGDGDAVEGAAGEADGEFAVGLVGLGEGVVGGDGEEGVEAGVVLLDAGETGFGESAGGGSFGAELGGGF